MSDSLQRLQQALGDRYTIHEEIGRGGMALVYAAQDRKHGRQVAIKVLRPDLAASVGRERFEREIKMAARLTHPHILPLHDSGDADGLLYFVMAYAEGGSLRGRLDSEGRLALTEALEIARRVAAALDYAHRHDVVHRDVKPENIMIHDGVAMVTDFGIGKAVSEAGAERITLPGAVVGTPAYMSPEQVSGESGVDGRSDVYSLACVLYEMLAGETPHAAPTTRAAIYKRLNEPPPHVRDKREAVPPEVEHALLTALATLPEERYQSVADFSRALTETDNATISMPRTPRRVSTDQSIAVLPFANLSTVPENEYLSDGITEEITNALTQIEGLGVASRTSAFAFKGKNLDIRRIGEQLNVTSVLEGSVRRAGNRLRITAQLVNVSDGYHLWSERFDREMEDVFAIQDEIAGAIVTTLKGRLAAEKHAQTVKRYTQNLEAYELYLKGRYVEKTRTRDGLTKGIEYFEKAIGEDEKYALAYTGLADSYYLQAWYRYLAPKEVFPLAKVAAAKALEIDEQLPEAHTSQGVVSFYYDWDWESAKRAFTRALELNPSDATAMHAYAEYLAARNRLDDALTMVTQAHQFDPLSLTINAGVGWIHYFRRDYGESIRQFEKTIELDPDYVFLNWFLGQSYLMNGLGDEAMAAFRRGLDRSGNHPGMAAYLALACARAGETEEALELLHGLESRIAEAYVPLDYLSVVCMGLGKTKEALGWLEQACDERALHLVFLGVDPVFDELRSDPRFTRVLHKIELEKA